jgi:hypothetical protein
MIRDPAADLCALFEGETLGGVTFVSGANLFSSGRQEPATKPAVYMMNVGGASPLPFLGGNREAMYSPSVQVLIEGIEDDWSGGESLAREVYAALQLADVPDYLGVLCRDSQPVYLGDNVWVVNVDATYAS